MKYLVIVESPTKAKTISKFLDKNYVIESSYGHIRDLPKSKMGVDVEHNFEPQYVIPPKSKTRVADLKKLASKSDIIYFATDQDREGEAIAWHLQTILGVSDKDVQRITFHEITKNAIVRALQEPHTINKHLVDAQQARRIIDRLVGYELSPFLWKKVAMGLSAGRVQSVTVRLIVEREREIDAFQAEEYWTVEGLAKKDAVEFPIALHARDGKPLKKFDLSADEAAKAREAIKATTLTISDISGRDSVKKVPTPFTTSTLQQEANRKLGFSAKQTMMLAQQLYEGVELGSEGHTGLITYMRTDSLNLSNDFTAATKKYLSETFGGDYAVAAPRAFKQKSKLAQEAHEAIRPTDVYLDPQSVKSHLNTNQYKLYTLIWSRAVASQMPDANVKTTTVDSTADKTPYTLRSTGSVVTFPGWLKVYPTSGEDKIIPDMKIGDQITLESFDALQHFTQPPARYSEASLVKALEEQGIGRPSTYAPTISTVIDRGYVEKGEDKRLRPTDMGKLVTDLLVEHFSQIVDYAFTAKIENELDDVAEGKDDWHKIVEAFYVPFHENLVQKNDDVSREDVQQKRVVGQDPKTGKDVIVRRGRFGAFVQLGEWSEEDKKNKVPKPRSASLPKTASLDSVTLEECLACLTYPKVLGQDEEGHDVTVNVGRYGPYISVNKVNAKMPEDETPENMTFEKALIILKEAKEKKEELARPLAELGEDPISKKPIIIKNGRFGPYITDGITNVSLGKKLTPEDVTPEKAAEMLEKKRHAPKRNWGRKKK